MHRDTKITGTLLIGCDMHCTCTPKISVDKKKQNSWIGLVTTNITRQTVYLDTLENHPLQQTDRTNVEEHFTGFLAVHMHPDS